MPQWKQFLQSRLKENIGLMGPSATYASLATVSKEGKPAVRTVVMRGFAGEHHQEKTGWESDLLVVHTNKHSNKVKELLQLPYTEINWYMNGTMEQFRIEGKVDIVDKHHVEWPSLQSTNQVEGDSLALESFLKHQGADRVFHWQAERLRHFIQLNPSMRAQMVTSQEIKELDITSIDSRGWFINPDAQDLLEEAFENFTLLVVHVNSVRYWSPSTGSKSML